MIHVATGDRERECRNEQARPGDDAAVDGIAYGYIGKARPSLSTSRIVVNPASRSFFAAATP